MYWIKDEEEIAEGGDVRALTARGYDAGPISRSVAAESKDQFRKNFELVRNDVLRANYGMNPWREKNGSANVSRTADFSTGKMGTA